MAENPPGVLSRIVAFFRGKGLGNAAAAGIAANAQNESGFDPGSLNPAEGAVGIFQWEGGRRTALQQFAAQRGTSETDLNTQLAFAWDELTGNYASVYQQLRGINDPAQAAAVWDVGPGGPYSGTGYENSSGSTTAKRRADARTIYAQLQSGQLNPGELVLGGAGGTPAGAQGFGAGFQTGNPGLGVLNPINWISGGVSDAVHSMGNLVIKSVITAGGLALVVVGLNRAAAPIVRQAAAMTPARGLAGKIIS